MPVVDLSTAGIVGANVAFWAVAQGTSGYLAHRLGDGSLDRDFGLLRLRAWERDGRVYERLGVRRWKDRLPEAGALFEGGASKRALTSRDPAGVQRLVVETRRAELAHWLSLVPLPLCVLWNPPLGIVLMAAYGVGVNLPFVVVQRYNRARGARLLSRARRSSGSSSSARDRTVPRTSGSSMP